MKWPNDILFDGAKLGGVLLERSGDAAGACQVVVGIGLNVSMPEVAAEEIDQAWTDISTIAGESPPGRSALLGQLLTQLLPLLAGFEETGFEPWREPWQRLDAYSDTPVVISSGPNKTAGVARGVDLRGALQLETTLGVQSVFGGEISLRAQQ